MKRVNFLQVQIKNFLSIGNTPVVVDFKPGLHIVTGINLDKVDRRNGIGKTSIIEAPYFAIFGTTIRDIKKDLIPNSFTNKTCEVKLEFNVEQSGKVKNYRIVRTLNPSKLYLYEDDKDITRDSIKNTEEDIQRILSASPSVFENCVIMTLNNTTPFMSKSKVDKRKFIEGIFNLEVFSQMLLAAREKYNEQKKTYEIELTKFENADRTAKDLSKQRESILNNRRNKLEVYKSRKANSSTERLDLIGKVEKLVTIDTKEIKNEITELSEALDKFSEKISKADKILTEATGDRRFKLSKHTQLEQDALSNFCKTCKRPLADIDTNCLHEMEQEKNTLKSEITELNESIKLIEDKREKLIDQKNKINSFINQLKTKLEESKLIELQRLSLQDKIKQLDVWLSQIDDDIKSLSSDSTELDDLLKESTQRVVEIREIVNDYRSQLALLETVKYVVSEEGVKSYIVKKILELFNSVFSNYLQKMDANCVCKFNEYFEEEIVNTKGKQCSYNSFSGAERKNIDFACLFTFMDMRRLQGDVTYNVSIYDELFDSSIDERGVELVTNILNERVTKYNECVMVISHRKESIKYATGDIIFLQKENDITKRVDYVDTSE